MSWLSLPTRAILEMVYPHHCILCGKMEGITPFVAHGSTVPGLRPWDRPHLCSHCFTIFVAKPAVLMEMPLLCGATLRTNPDLVELIGQWKYYGIRGLGWPMAAMLVPVIKKMQSCSKVDAIIPIPLHSARQRKRGFNQAEMLARLAGSLMEMPIICDLLYRQRNTRQQARLRGNSLRQENIQGAFRLSEESACGTLCIGLIDDLVTTGATAQSAAQTLEMGGYQVKWVASLGIASKKSSE